MMHLLLGRICCLRWLLLRFWVAIYAASNDRNEVTKKLLMSQHDTFHAAMKNCDNIQQRTKGKKQKKTKGIELMIFLFGS